MKRRFSKRELRQLHTMWEQSDNGNDFAATMELKRTLREHGWPARTIPAMMRSAEEVLYG